MPLEYELDSNVDIDTISYDVENFEYNIRISTDGTVTSFYTTDGTYEMRYNGDVKVTDLNVATRID